MRTEFETDVRYYETDQMGIVHHSNYIRYFECGRSDFLKKAGFPMDKVEEAGIMMPVIAVDCRYRLPAKMGDTLRIVTFVDQMPTAKLTVGSEIYNQDGVLLCNGSVTLGFIDASTRRPVRCPEFLKRLFEE